VRCFDFCVSFFVVYEPGVGDFLFFLTTLTCFSWLLVIFPCVSCMRMAFSRSVRATGNSLAGFLFRVLGTILIHMAVFFFLLLHLDTLCRCLYWDRIYISYYCIRFLGNANSTTCISSVRANSP